jgi:hypothetical protein
VIEKISKAIEDFTLDPTPVDGLFMEVCTLINMIFSIDEVKLSVSETTEKIQFIDDQLASLEERSESLNILFLTSQIKQYRMLLDSMK